MENRVIIFCAPSGSGKTTIVKHLLSCDHRLSFSVSACTRKARENEIHGKDYYFISKEEFKEHIAKNEFLEHEEVYDGNYYGTLLSEVNRIWKLDKVVLFDVDVDGGLNIKSYFGEKALGVFVMPPDIITLEKRLRSRSTETETSIKTRITKAVEELKFADKFDFILLNDDLEKALVSAENLVNNFLSATQSE